MQNLTEKSIFLKNIKLNRRFLIGFDYSDYSSVYFGIDLHTLFQLAEDGGLDWDALEVALKPQTKCALIQRSCGYSWRKSLSVYEISRAINIIKVCNLLL